MKDASPPSLRQPTLGLLGNSDVDSDDDDMPVEVRSSPARRRSVTLPTADLPKDEPKIDIDVDLPIPIFVESRIVCRLAQFSFEQLQR